MATLAEMRRLHRMTQQDLATAAGLSISTIPALESGRYRPSYNTQQALRCVFGADYEQIKFLDPALPHPRRPRGRPPRTWAGQYTEATTTAEGGNKMILSYDEALTLLQVCKPLVARLLEAEGIYTALNTAEMQVLEGFATVGQSGLLEEGAQATSLRRQAELRPSDLGMLMGRLAQEQWQRDPEGVMMEIRAMLNGARNRADLS